MEQNSYVEMIKVTLECGRSLAGVTDAGNAPDMCGACEDSTNNQTQATCCY